MSGDIPVGSPPVPPGRHAAPGGWYPDPVDAARERYWDGWQWSRNTREAESSVAGGSPLAGYSVQDGSYPQPGSQQYGNQPYGGQSHGGQQPGPDQAGAFPPPHSPNPYSPGPQDPGGQNPYASGQPQLGGQYPGGPYPGQYPGGQYPGQYAPQPLPGAQATMTADGVPLAGWWMRVLAAFIDGVIVGVLYTIPTFPFTRRAVEGAMAYFNEAMRAAQSGSPPPPTLTANDLMPWTDQVIITAITIAVSLAYHALFLRLKSATPGKLATGLKVVPVDQGRSTAPLSWGSIGLRCLVWLAPMLFSLLSLLRLVDVLFPLGQKKRQALHDLAAKTQVIRIR